MYGARSAPDNEPINNRPDQRVEGLTCEERSKRRGR